MRAKTLSDLLKASDRIAVSNITGREASTVTVDSQKYCKNIVGGWALGKGGQTIDVPGAEPIPVFPTVQELMNSFPKKKRPNKTQNDLFSHRLISFSLMGRSYLLPGSQWTSNLS